MTDHSEKFTSPFHLGKTVKIFFCILILFFPTMPIFTDHTRTGSVASHAVVEDPVFERTHSNSPRDDPVSFINYDDVILIVNDNSEMSKDIANYFIANRVFPPENIINISVPSGETISLAQFADLREQVEDNITSRNLTTRINYIITTKGVPLRISGNGDYKASVDSELALILGSNKGYIGGYRWLTNPYYGKEGHFNSQTYQMYLVTRLTAYTFEEVKAIIDKAAESLNVTGKFILDVDPGRDGSPGYKIGNDWLRGANSILTPRGYEIIHDETNTFVNNETNVAGYASWGSNDGHWFLDRLTNSNMESDSDSDGIPNSWYAVLGGTGSVERTNEDSYRNTYSVNITRTSSGSDSTTVFQNFTVEPDSRYYLSGYANLSGVTNEGSAHIQIRAHNAQEDIVWVKNGTIRRGTTSQWASMGQVVYEPIEGVKKISVGGVLSKSAGTVYFDYIRLNEIRPHIEFVPGAIAETFVSTGGRSFNYPTSYGQSLVADLLREGVTGVKGYTWEPYLSAISHPDILFDRYTAGHNLAQSFWSGSNFVSWMGTVVGDPKCCPYMFNRAELEITDFSVSDESPAQSDTIFINATIRNSGKTKTPSFQVYLRNGSEDGEVLSSSSMAIDPNDSKIFSFELDLSERAGWNHFVLDVDATDKVMEIHEDDNRDTIDLYVNSQPIIDIPLPVITINEDSSNFTLDMSAGYFVDPESDTLLFSPTLVNPTQAQSDNVDIWVEGSLLHISTINNHTDENVSIRIYCNDRIPVAAGVYQDTYIVISPLNDPPFVLTPPVPIVLAEDGYAVSEESIEEIFDDFDSEKLYYAIGVDPHHNHSRELGDMVEIFLDDNNNIVVNAGGNFFGNITVRVYCSDYPINGTEEHVFIDFLGSDFDANDTEGLLFVDISIVITAVNDPPFFSDSEFHVSIAEDSFMIPVLDLWNISIDVDDPFSELDFEILEVVPEEGAEISIENGTLVVTIPENHTDRIVVKLELSDGEYSDICYIYVEPFAVNDPPVITVKNVLDLGDGNFTIEYSFIDSDSPANQMKLDVFFNGSLLFSISNLKSKWNGDGYYGAMFNLDTGEYDIPAGNHTLELVLIDNGSAKGHALIQISVSPVVEPYEDDDVDDDGEDDGRGDDDENDTVGKNKESELSTTYCLIILFISAALGVVAVFIHLTKKKKREREQRKAVREEKWKMLYGDDSDGIPPPPPDESGESDGPNEPDESSESDGPNEPDEFDEFDKLYESDVLNESGEFDKLYGSDVLNESDEFDE